MKVAIIGYGHVGKAMHTVFPDAVIHDKYPPVMLDEDSFFRPQSDVNACDLAFVCVPTPSASDGSCDTSAVEEVIRWCEAPVICIKSTVPPGTTMRLQRETGKQIAMSPEFEGETPWQGKIADWPYVIAGGEAAETVLDAYRSRLGPGKSYWATDATTAELVKYMENVWLALQVTFAGEFYDIARVVGADYNQARELWALDPRVSKWHTLVFPDDRGFGGKCLPKDLSAIIVAAEFAGHYPALLRAIQQVNEGHIGKRLPVSHR